MPCSVQVNSSCVTGGPSIVSETGSVAEAFFILLNIRSRSHVMIFFQSHIAEVSFRVGVHDQIHFFALVTDL